MWPLSRQPVENMVKFGVLVACLKFGKSLKSPYLVMDKNNFDDNNNKRYTGDHHHRYQDPNIIYKSLEQDIVNLILLNALQKLITCFSFFFLISSSISFCDLSVHSTNALSSIASLSLSISLKYDQVWSHYSGHTCDGSDLHLSWPPSHTLDSDLLNLATDHRQRQAVVRSISSAVKHTIQTKKTLIYIFSVNTNCRIDKIDIPKATAKSHSSSNPGPEFPKVKSRLETKN